MPPSVSAVPISLFTLAQHCQRPPANVNNSILWIDKHLRDLYMFCTYSEDMYHYSRISPLISTYTTTPEEPIGGATSPGHARVIATWFIDSINAGWSHYLPHNPDDPPPVFDQENDTQTANHLMAINEWATTQEQRDVLATVFSSSLVSDVVGMIATSGSVKNYAARYIRTRIDSDFAFHGTTASLSFASLLTKPVVDKLTQLITNELLRHVATGEIPANVGSGAFTYADVVALAWFTDRILSRYIVGVEPSELAGTDADTWWVACRLVHTSDDNDIYTAGAILLESLETQLSQIRSLYPDMQVYAQTLFHTPQPL